MGFYFYLNGTGGLVGSNFNEIIDSYSTGAVSGPAYIGGLVGSYYTGFHATAEVVNSYWDTQSSGQGGSAAGTPKTTIALQSGLPTGFDPTVWGSNSTINNGYPYLLWQIASNTLPNPSVVLTPIINTSSSTPSLPPAQNQINPILGNTKNNTPSKSSLPVIPATLPVASAQQSLESLISSPSAWLDIQNVYGLVNLFLQIHSYADLNNLIPTLQALGIYDPQTVSQLQTELVRGALTDFGLKLAYDATVNQMLNNFEQKGYITDPNKVVLQSLADTAFNVVTANLPGEIADQSFQIAIQFAAINQSAAALVNSLIKSGASDIQLWQKANELKSANSASSTEEANKITGVVSTSIATTNAVMNSLANGSMVPSQIEATNKWSIIAAVLNAVYAQMQGRQSAVPGYIEIAKQLAANLDKAYGTYNVPVTESYLHSLNNQYQTFAAVVAQQYGVSGWFAVQ